MDKLKSLDQLLTMLEKLDEWMVEHDRHIEIRAIGGFAVMCNARANHVEWNRLSSDIDTLTEDYPGDVLQAIDQIGNEFGTADSGGWLNNEWNKTMKYHDEFAFFAEWRDASSLIKLRNVDLKYCDLETIFYFKMRAVDTRIRQGSLPREKDVNDVIRILQFFKEKDIKHIKNAKMSTCIAYFPRAVEHIDSLTHGQGTRLP